MEINPGDIVNAEVRKADVKQDAGLTLIETDEGVILVSKAEGLFKRRNIPILPGDRIHEIFGRDVEDFEGGLNEIKALMKKELRIWLKFERMESEVYESDEEEEEDREELLMIEGGEESSDDEEEHLMLTNGSPHDESNSDDVEEYRTDGTDTVNDSDSTEDHIIRPGVELRIFKYKKKPKLNGTVVRVLKWSGGGIWEVELIGHPMREIDTGSRLSIDQEYLIALE